MFVNDVELSEDSKYVVPGIKVINNAITNPQELIDIANSVPEGWGKSSVGGVNHVDEDIRRSNSFMFPVHFNNPLAFFATAQKIYLYAQLYAQENNMPFSHMEPISMLEYVSNDGFYKPHSDSGPDLPRQFSAVLYLNDVEEGGETYFNEYDLHITPQAGRLVLFPSSFPFIHEARSPQEGNKYVLVTWFGLPINTSVFQEYYI